MADESTPLRATVIERWTSKPEERWAPVLLVAWDAVPVLCAGHPGAAHLLRSLLVRWQREDGAVRGSSIVAPHGSLCGELLCTRGALRRWSADLVRLRIVRRKRVGSLLQWSYDLAPFLAAMRSADGVHHVPGPKQTRSTVDPVQGPQRTGYGVHHGPPTGSEIDPLAIARESEQDSEPRAIPPARASDDPTTVRGAVISDIRKRLAKRPAVTA